MGLAGLRMIAWAAAALLAVATAFAPGLAAQGAKPATAGGKRGMTASRPVSHIQPARDLLGSLVGSWRFEIWFAGNFGAADASGTRVVKGLFDDLHVEWTEQLDHSPIQGQGIVGFDASSDRFFSSSVDNVASATELMTGVPDDAQPSITFYMMSVSPGAPDPPTLSSTLAILDPDHFTSLAADGSWRAVFTRMEEGDSASEVSTRQHRAGENASASIIQAALVAAASDPSRPDSLQHPAAIR